MIYNNSDFSWRSYKGRIIAATPLICIIAYVLVGYYTQIWFPTLAIFSLIIIVPTILSEDFLYSMFPILVIVAYFVLGFLFSWWHPGWVLFLTIPIYYMLIQPFLKKRC